MAATTGLADILQDGRAWTDLQDLRHATGAREDARLTFIVIFTLAVGIGANTAMFSIVNGVLLEGCPFVRPSDLDLNEVEREERNRGAIAPATFADWQRLATTSRRWRPTGRARSTSIHERRARAAAGRDDVIDLFDVLGVAPILGRQFTRDDAAPGRGQNVVLSYGFWCRFGGSPDALNQTVRLNGTPYTVVGVMPVTVNPAGRQLLGARRLRPARRRRRRPARRARGPLPARHRPDEAARRSTA
jgi:hypothetical protein